MGDAKSTMLVGRIGGAYGIKGWVHVKSFTEPAETIFGYSPWHLRAPIATRLMQMAELDEGKPHGKSLIAKLQGIADRDAAEGLRGLEIHVDRDRLPELAEGQFYWSDLEGLRVEDSNGVELGQVDHLLDTGAQDVMVVTGKSRHLIPFCYGDTVLGVDLQAGLIRVDWDVDD